MKVWTSQEVREFLESAGTDRLRALWLLAATTGMRRGELCGLMWKDVNFEASNVAVRRARVPIAGKVAEGTPKPDRARVISGYTICAIPTRRSDSPRESRRK